MIQKKTFFLAFSMLFSAGLRGDLFTPASDPRKEIRSYKDTISRFFWRFVFRHQRTVRKISKEATEGYDITRHFSYGVPAGIHNTTLEDMLKKTDSAFPASIERTIEGISALTVPALLCGLSVTISSLAQFIDKKRAQIHKEHDQQDTDGNNNTTQALDSTNQGLEQDAPPINPSAEEPEQEKPFDQVALTWAQELICDYAFFALIYGGTRICFKNIFAQKPLFSKTTALLSLAGLHYLSGQITAKHAWNTILSYYGIVRKKVDQLFSSCIPDDYSNNIIMKSMRQSLQFLAFYYASRLWISFTKGQYDALTSKVESSLFNFYGRYAPRDKKAQETYNTVAHFVREYQNDITHKKLTPCTAHGTWYQLGHRWCTCRNNAITLLSYIACTNAENAHHTKHDYTIVNNHDTHHECHVCKQKPSSLLATKNTPCSHYTCAFCVVGKRSFCQGTQCNDNPTTTTEELKNSITTTAKLVYAFGKRYLKETPSQSSQT